MQIKILGNGGAINDGLPYNSFMVDDFFLAEVPPDIMSSLFREKSDISKIRIIFISHFHGDHYFGLPFLILRLFFNESGNNLKYRIRILGPAGISNQTKELCRMAFGENHPVNVWLELNFIFVDLSSDCRHDIDENIYLKFFPMFHFTGTYGFSFYSSNNIRFCYFADTVWNEELIEQIKLFPELIITDLNGEFNDPVKVHLSEIDILEKAIPFSDGKIMYYGTHLKTEKQSLSRYIRYVRSGDVIQI